MSRGSITHPDLLERLEHQAHMDEHGIAEVSAGEDPSWIVRARLLREAVAEIRWLRESALMGWWQCVGPWHSRHKPIRFLPSDYPNCPKCQAPVDQGSR